MNIRVDILNTVLLVIALLLSVYFPFELFLLAYAILGPLHYLTEINWVRDKAYFIKSKIWLYVAVTLAFLVSIPAILKLVWPNFSKFQTLDVLLTHYESITNIFIFLALVIATSFILIKDRRTRLGLVCMGFVMAFLLKDITVFNIWVGILLPTIIHVYVFTVLFSLYGNLKTHSKIGYLNTAFLVLIPFLIVGIPLDEHSYLFSNDVKDIIIENRFFVLNSTIANLLGLSDDNSFFFNGIIDLKIQIMIAFAYTYHYLNWFSKTTIIGWHRKLTSKKSFIIVMIWLTSIALYFYDYKTGLTFLLVLSLIHVFLEFPLNIISIQGISKYLSKKFNTL